MVADDDVKPRRRLGPTGVGSSGLTDDEKTRLKKELRRRLEDELDAQGVTADARFYDVMDRALVNYCAFKNLHEYAPGSRKIRSNLNRALHAARKLDDSISGLDIHSWTLLGETCPGGHDELRSRVSHVKELTARLSATYALAREYPNNRPIDYPRLFCASMVAEAFRRHTDAKPTTTRDGPFAVVMEILLTEILGERRRMSPGPLKSALEFKWIEREDGVIELHPAES